MPKFACTVEGCTKVCFSEEYMAAHQRQHQGLVPFLCPHEGCGKAFEVMCNLKTHIQIHDPNCKYQCPSCSMVFTRSRKFKEHLSSAHDIRHKAGKQSALEPNTPSNVNASPLSASVSSFPVSSPSLSPSPSMSPSLPGDNPKISLATQTSPRNERKPKATKVPQNFAASRHMDIASMLTPDSPASLGSSSSTSLSSSYSSLCSVSAPINNSKANNPNGGLAPMSLLFQALAQQSVDQPSHHFQLPQTQLQPAQPALPALAPRSANSPQLLPSINELFASLGDVFPPQQPQPQLQLQSQLQPQMNPQSINRRFFPYPVRPWPYS